MTTKRMRDALAVVTLTFCCGMFVATGAYAQGGAACLVNEVRVKAEPAVTSTGTGLNVEVHFTNGTVQTQPGVNQGAPWPKAVVAVIQLQPPMPLNTIKRIRLIYNGNLRAPAWSMTSMHARAVGNTVSAIIATAGPHQFTLAKPAFGVDTTIPGSACFIGARPIAGPVRVAPGTPVQRTGPLMNTGAQQTMLGAQAKPLLADGSVRTATAPTGTPEVGASQTMSATGNAGNSRMLAPPQTVAPAGSPSTNSGALTLGGGSSQGGSGAGTNPSLQPLVPRGGSNTSSGGTGLMSLKPLTPRGSSGSTPATGGAPTPTPSKGHGRSDYDAMTVERGATADPGFTNWANSAQAPSGSANSQAAGPQTITTPATGTRIGTSVAEARSPVTLNSVLVRSECEKDPGLRILGVAGSAEPITFVPGHRYRIWGCSFGPANPNNAVYLSDGSSFTWYLEKISWGANSVVVSVSTAPKNGRNNLMLFVLGQNGNTKLNGVALSAQ